MALERILVGNRGEKRCKPKAVPGMVNKGGAGSCRPTQGRNVAGHPQGAGNAPERSVGAVPSLNAVSDH